MKKEKLSDTNDLKKRIENLHKTAQMRKSVLDKMMKNLNEKNKYKQSIKTKK